MVMNKLPNSGVGGSTSAATRNGVGIGGSGGGDSGSGEKVSTPILPSQAGADSTTDSSGPNSDIQNSRINEVLAPLASTKKM